MKGWCGMISIVKKKNKLNENLLSKIEWACSLNAIKLEHDYFYVGDLRYKYPLSQLKDYIERL